MQPEIKVVLVLTVIVGIILPLSSEPAFLPPAAALHEMAKFGSNSELVKFIQVTPAVCNSAIVPRPGIRSPVTETSVNGVDTMFSNSAASPEYSITNVQVQGVDELDTVKTDGTYIYTITNNTLVIVKASPTSEAQVVSKIVPPNGTLTGVFVFGNSLVLIGRSGYEPIVFVAATTGLSTGIAQYWYYSPSTSLWVYDISDTASPQLKFSLLENGTYVGSRLINNSVYLITTQYATLVGNVSVTLPSRVVNGQVQTTPPTQIYHSDVQDYSYSFTTVSRVGLSSSPSMDSQSFLISSNGALYASTQNIYLTSPIWTCRPETLIHRVNIGNAGISYQATGTVPGSVMNQFSMDENQGFFRVATYTYQYFQMNTLATTTQSVAPSTSMGPGTNVYVLDMELHIVGSLEGISPGETFYAARFFGDKAYLVTFQRVDPLFAVDLSDPYHPRILGQLEITGVSDYLQPYDENHLIGFGKSSVNLTWENAALFQGLKLSLLDVSDPSHPIDVSDYVVGDRGTDSPALTDSHAILFERSLNLLVIPVEVAQIIGTPTNTWQYGTPIWQGAYVFNISPSGGIMFRGGITHLPNGELPSGDNTALFVNRSLYIGNVLYTLSSSMIRMNSLTDLSDLGGVTL